MCKVLFLCCDINKHSFEYFLILYNIHLQILYRVSCRGGGGGRPRNYPLHIYYTAEIGHPKISPLHIYYTGFHAEVGGVP